MTPPPKRDRRGGSRGGSRGAGPKREGPPRGRGGSRPKQALDLGGDQVEGRRSVLELLEADRRPVLKVYMAADLDSSEQLDRIEALCGERRVHVDVVSRSRLEREAGTESHQGVIARTRALQALDLDDLMCDGSTQSGLPATKCRMCGSNRRGLAPPPSRPSDPNGDESGRGGD